MMTSLAVSSPTCPYQLRPRGLIARTPPLILNNNVQRLAALHVDVVSPLPAAGSSSSSSPCSSNYVRRTLLLHTPSKWAPTTFGGSKTWARPSRSSRSGHVAIGTLCGWRATGSWVAPLRARVGRGERIAGAPLPLMTSLAHRSVGRTAAEVAIDSDRRTGRVLQLGLGTGFGIGVGRPLGRGISTTSRGERRVGSARAAASADGVVATSTAAGQVKGAVHLVVSLGLFLALDSVLKKAFLSAAIRFPSALFGMFCIFSVLLALDAVFPKASSSIVGFFEPANLFIQRWLPLFYVPSLVMLPLAIRGIPATAGAKIMVILTVGWVCSLAFTGQTAMVIRRIVRTEMLPTEPMSKPPPFSQQELKAWTLVGVLSFAMAVLAPLALGSHATTALPFLLSSTVVGYLLGLQFPAGVKNILHPIITCAIAADLGAFLLGLVNRKGFYTTLELYLTKSASVGAGDILMGFLGSVILSFAFSMFNQRKLVKHHAAEIFTAVISGAAFSLYSTALVGRLLGLEPLLTRAIIPRCVTVALALPIANLLEASNPSLTAAAVVLTGLIGANFTQSCMDRFGFHDPISRGMATACSAHGLGTAALAGKEPEALPFCAIAYALTGICSSVICAVPIVRESLIMIAG